MVFVFDGIGHQDWANRKDIKIVVPVSDKSSSVHMPCDRSSRRASLFVCIAADGTFVQQIVIVPCHTLEQNLYEINYTPNRALLERQENILIYIHLFEKWAIYMFFSDLEVVRRTFEYGG
jgi:hypothetical protein